MPAELELEHLQSKLWEIQQQVSPDPKVVKMFEERIRHLQLIVLGGRNGDDA